MWQHIRVAVLAAGSLAAGDAAAQGPVGGEVLSDQGPMSGSRLWDMDLVRAEQLPGRGSDPGGWNGDPMWGWVRQVWEMSAQPPPRSAEWLWRLGDAPRFARPTDTREKRP